MSGFERNGSLPFSEMVFGRPDTAAMASYSGTPVHVDSAPAGAQVRIDGKSFGQTPLDTRLSPGQHTLELQHPDTLDEEHLVHVANTAAKVDVELWRRRARSHTASTGVSGRVAA
jgi:hypothetical protein